MSRFHLSRRSVLRGMGGVVVALPSLEIMNQAVGGGRAEAAVPKKYVIGYCGVSLAERGLQHFLPTATGPAYALTKTLEPLGKRGIKDDTTLVTGLEMADNQSTPGGRDPQFHWSAVTPQITGLRSPEPYSNPKGPSHDFIVSKILGTGTRFPLVNMRMEVSTSQVSFGVAGILSFNDSGGSNDTKDSPKAIYDSIFTGFVPPSGMQPDPGAMTQVNQELVIRKSVLDFVRADTERLLPRLGSWDKQRVQQHFDEIRALENRLGDLDPGGGTGGGGGMTTSGCKLPASPTTDPAKYDPTYSRDYMYYSGEKERAPVLVDLAYMALACGQTNVLTLMFNRWKSHLNMKAITGHASDYHEISHGAMGSTSDEALAICNAWHLDMWADLVARLKATPDGAGKNLLDSTAAMFHFEGGFGDTNEESRAHSTKNMTVLVAGRAGGLAPKGHLVAKGRHPASVFISTMKAVGYTGYPTKSYGADQLGEISGGIAELF